MRWAVAIIVLAFFVVQPGFGAPPKDLEQENERVVPDHSGIWRNTIVGVGVSYWELTARKDGTYDAQEIGMGNRRGTAKVQDGSLIIRFEADGHVGVYNWPLQRPAGRGTYTQTFADGQPPLKYSSSGRFLGR